MARRLAWLLILQCCLVDVAMALEPHAGRLLVATPRLQDPGFAETVILLLEYDSEYGALGLVINRRGRLSPAEALPEYPELKDYPGRLHYGGPVSLHTMLLLVRGLDPDTEGLQPVVDDIGVSTDPELLRELAGQGLGPQRLRLFAGYAGWAPGQLEGELRAGAWRVHEASAALVFSPQPEQLWRRLMPAREPFQVRRQSPRPTRPDAGPDTRKSRVTAGTTRRCSARRSAECLRWRVHRG